MQTTKKGCIRREKDKQNLKRADVKRPRIHKMQEGHISCLGRHKRMDRRKKKHTKDAEGNKKCA